MALLASVRRGTRFGGDDRGTAPFRTLGLSSLWHPRRGHRSSVWRGSGRNEGRRYHSRQLLVVLGRPRRSSVADVAEDCADRRNGLAEGGTRIVRGGGSPELAGWASPSSGSLRIADSGGLPGSDANNWKQWFVEPSGHEAHRCEPEICVQLSIFHSVFHGCGKRPGGERGSRRLVALKRADGCPGHVSRQEFQQLRGAEGRPRFLTTQDDTP